MTWSKIFIQEFSSSFVVAFVTREPFDSTIYRYKSQLCSSMTTTVKLHTDKHISSEYTCKFHLIIQKFQKKTYSTKSIGSSSKMFDNVVDQYESDGDDYNPKAHKKLLTGVSRLQKSQFIKKATRDEPVQKRNEFNLVKLSNTDQVSSKRGKIDVNDLVNVLDKTSKNLQLGKGLKKTTKKKKVLPIPLQKPAAEKLKRAINYVKIKEKLERWDAVVAKNRTADHLVIFFFFHL